MGKSVRSRPEGTRPALERRLDGMTWDESKTDELWVTSRIPEGEAACARIQKSSRNSDGTYSYFCYRDCRAIDIAKSLDEAKAACARGTVRDTGDPVLEYVRDRPGELPPFLLLTTEERRAVRAQYPFAAPSETRVRVAAHRARAGGAVTSDQGTAALLAEMEAGGLPERVARVPRERGASPQGVLARVREGNPKKPGSGAHTRWEILFAHCARAGTAEAYAADGGNLDTLANAVRAGYVTVTK